MKSICIPCSGPVATGDYLSVIDHPLFQRLRHCRQLGLNDLVFPGAQHTRFEHALGVLARIRAAAAAQRFTPAEQRLLELFALLHDIGHGPFSHQVEPVLAGDHHQRGLLCLSEMADAIRACGAEPADLQAMLNDGHPLAAWVSDRNLGADKLDYLQRDAFHIGFTGLPDLDIIQRHTMRTPEGGLALHEKFIEEGKRLQKFYSYLHQHGYLNKTALIAQRILQRALQEELTLDRSREDDLWRMTDFQLLDRLAHAQSPLARTLVQRLIARDLPRTCLCIKPTGYAYVENAVGKPIAVLEWPRARLAHFSQHALNLDFLRAFEDALARAAGLQPGELVLAAMPYFTKLLPKDLRIFNGGERDYWLFDQDKDHRASLESDYLRTFALRIAVPADARQRLADNPAPLLDAIDG
jgi:HD superfamily phosphohydrolase